ncbi:MAG: efflux RND transporter permease subunit [Myxococcales bacterium]|nr:efflux RND transporter permease subunit [Myxococcales bacterium]
MQAFFAGVIRQPILVNLMAVAALLIGALVMRDMTRESLPAVPTGWARVSVVYPGASPEEVEQLVLDRLEEAVANVDDVAELWGAAREGIALVFIQFEPSVRDIPRKVLEVQGEVTAIDDLPEGAERPQVREFQVTVPTIAVSIRGDAPEAVLRRVSLDLAERLEGLRGVGEVQRNGLRDRRITVDVDPDRLVARGLPLAAVAEALGHRAANVPAGSLGERDARLVRGIAQVRTADEVREVVVRPALPGPAPGTTSGAVWVGDVAEVDEGFAPAEITGRVNGQPGVLLLVNKEAQADSLRISDAVRETVAAFELPEGVSVDVFGDAAHEVRRSLDSLYGNAATGLVLVLALLWLFVGARNATMAALGIPVALAGAIAAMSAMGITINVISLLALILCLGVVVDDAIIIIENVYRHMEEGRPRTRAVIEGSAEVFWPVLASTLTTCAAFLPMLMMVGVLGEFFSIIPKVVVVALAASLVEAFIVLPSHLRDFGQVRRRKHGATAARPATRWERIGARVGALYERTLRGALRWRWAVAIGAYGLAAGLVAAAVATKDVVLFTDGDTELFDVRVKLPTDSSKEETDAVLREVERRLLALDGRDVEAVVTARGITRTEMGVDRGDHVGMVTMYLKPIEERSVVGAGRALLAEASRLFDDIVGPVSLEVMEFKPGPPRGAPVAVRVRGHDLDRLADLAGEVADEIRQVPGTRTVATDYQLGKRELRVEVDEERAALHGLTPPQVAGWLRLALGAQPVATTRVGGDEVDVVVRLAEGSRDDPQRLAQLAMVTPDGGNVALQEVATIEPGRGPALIRHRERERMITVTAQIDERQTTSAEVNRLVSERLAPLVAGSPDVTFSLGGEYERTQESLESLVDAFGVALLVIFTILAAQFRSFLQPLVVMGAIPLSFIGVVIGFFVSGAPIGLIALIGVVGLAGIVVNDSLVLVDFINQRRRAGVERDEAIVQAGILRLRPIFLTSITTIAGLFPLALAGAASPLLSPMATAIAWGLAFATALMLLVVPCFYRIVDDLGGGLSRRLAPLLRWATDPGDASDDDAPASSPAE